MILTVFRSRLNPGVQPMYEHHVETTSSLVEGAAGFVAHKVFTADDGERVTLVEFDNLENQRAWSLSAAHKAAAIAGRKGFYAEYRIQICDVVRDSNFVAPPTRPAGPARCPFGHAVRVPARADGAGSRCA